MTTAEMIAEVQASLGNRTDFQDPNPGYARIVNWLNWSQYELCGFHKEHILPPRRFHCLEGDKIFPTIVLNQLTSMGSADLKTVFINGGSAVAEYYTGWTIETTSYDEVGAGSPAPAGMIGQKRMIRSYTGGPSFLASVWPDWDVAPDAYVYITLHKRSYGMVADIGIDPNATIWTIERLEDAATGAEIDQQPWSTIVGADPMNFSKPTRFARRGNSIIFDPTPDQEYYFKIYHYAFPTRLQASTPNVSPVFAEYWHHVIVEGATWFGFDKTMEPTRAAQKKQEWIDMAGNKQDEFSIEAKHERRGARLKMRK